MHRQLSMESMWLMHEIGERGYAEFTHGISPDQIEELVSCYTDFTLAHPDPEPATMDAMLPAGSDRINLDDLDRSKDTQASWHKYRTNLPAIGKPAGYTNRSYQVRALGQARGLQIDDDPKEYYHYHPDHRQELIRVHQEYNWGTLPAEASRLDSAFWPVHQRAAALMTRICASIEDIHPEVNKIITPASLRTSPVRLLFYHPVSSERLAAAHYDKSFCTLQIGESHTGLRVAKDNEQPLTEIVRDHDKAVFFTGHMLGGKPDPGTNSPGGFFPESPLQPGWHDVTETGALNPGRTIPIRALEVCGRWALIFFANPAVYRNPDKAAMHRR